MGWPALHGKTSGSGDTGARGPVGRYVSFYLRSAEIASLIATSISRDRSFLETSFISSPTLTHTHVYTETEFAEQLAQEVLRESFSLSLSLCVHIVEFFKESRPFRCFDTEIAEKNTHLS